MDKKKRAAIKEDNSDFEHLKAWQNNPDLGYYRSEKHWNVHVNIALYRMLSQFYETIGVYEYLQRPLASNRDLFYGYLLNEAYRLCHIVLTSDVPDAKMSYLFDEAETLIIRDWNIPAGHLPPQPNFVDRILSYHILGVVNVILSFANDQKDSIDRFLYDLSLYNDEGVVYNGMHQSFKTYYKQYEQFVAVGLIFSSALRPGYDYKGKDNHLRKKILMYKYIAEELEEKRAAAEKKTVAENDAVMEESVLDKISPSNLRYYYEGWRNGKHGSICQKDGIYRFVEMARGKSGILDDVKRKEEDNPIVAKGIVAYWLQFNSRMDTVIKRLTKYNCEIPKDIREQFENYTQIRFEQFKREHRDDPNTLDWDWDREFYANVIIPHEMAFNKLSEALFDYISDSDIVLVRGVMNSYIKYLKKIRTEKEYQVNPELLVLRAINSGDDTKQEDLEEFEVNTILDNLEEKGYIHVAWIEGHRPEAVRLLDKGRLYLKHLEEGSVVVATKSIVTPQQPLKENTEGNPPQTQNCSVREITWAERKQCFKTAVLVVMEKKKADGNYLFQKNAQWKAVYRFAIDKSIMYELDDSKEPKDSSTPQYALFEDFAHELHLDENPPTRLPFTKNAIDNISKDNFVRYNAPYPWSYEGITDPRSLELYVNMDDVYSALVEEYDNCIRQAEKSAD